jgi:hypothetical protein
MESNKNSHLTYMIGFICVAMTACSCNQRGGESEQIVIALYKTHPSLDPSLPIFFRSSETEESIDPNKTASENEQITFERELVRVENLYENNQDDIQLMHLIENAKTLNECWKNMNEMLRETVESERRTSLERVDIPVRNFRRSLSNYAMSRHVYSLELIQKAGGHRVASSHFDIE